jgi:hypothetical protein
LEAVRRIVLPDVIDGCFAAEVVFVPIEAQDFFPIL